MVRLRVQEVAESRGMNLSQLSFKTSTSLTSVRRYWYGTKKGTRTGEPLRSIDLDVLERIAQALEVSVLELLADDKVSNP